MSYIVVLVHSPQYARPCANLLSQSFIITITVTTTTELAFIECLQSVNPLVYIILFNPHNGPVRKDYLWTYEVDNIFIPILQIGKV